MALEYVEHAELQISNPEGFLSTAELAEWLLLFRAAYGAAAQDRGLSAEEILRSPQDACLGLLLRMRSESYGIDDLVSQFLWNLPADDELVIELIVYASDPKLRFRRAILGALVAASILSGGEVNISPNGFKFNLPPIGVGLQELRKVFFDQATETSRSGVDIIEDDVIPESAAQRTHAASGTAAGRDEGAASDAPGAEASPPDAERD